MATVKKILNTITNKACPDVFLESTHIYTLKNGPTAKIMFKLFDEESLWINNKNILNELYVYILVNNILVAKKGLSSLKRSKKLNELTGEVLIDLTSENILVQAYTGNEFIRGNSASEQILNQNNLVASSYEQKTYSFINKNKDFRLLDFNEFLKFKNNIPTKEEQSFTNKRAYISYNTNKKANIAYLFDLEKELEKRSPAYKLLKNNQKIRKNILKNCKILEDTSFYKRNLSLENNEFEKFGTFKAYKVSSSDMDHRYIITAVDEDNEKYNFSTYKLKIKISFFDATYKIIKEDFLDNVQQIKNFILKYKNNLELLEANNLVKNYKIYFFENEYENFLNTGGNKAELINTVRYLANIFSITSDYSIQQYYTLLNSIFNPLTYNNESTEALLSAINTLENYYRILFYSVPESFSEQIKTNKENIVFSTELLDEIDYNYNELYGFDVISEVPYSNKQALDSSIKIISAEQKNLRKIAESSKILNRKDSATVDAIQYFSISNLFLEDESQNLLDLSKNLDLEIFNKNFTKLSCFNNNKKFYNLEETQFNELSDAGVYIKSIVNSKNTSKSKFFKNLLFDANPDSKNASKQTLKNFKINNMYLYLSKYKYEIPTWSQTQYLINQQNNLNFRAYTIGNSTVQPYQKNYDTELAAVMMFNNFFKDVKLTEGANNYDLYELQPAHVNNIFTEKLKFFNQYYIIENQISQPFEEVDINPFREDLLNYNILPIYINRNILLADNTSILDEI